MSNLIQQLKQKFVFGWVSEELQAKCREIGTENFEYYDIHGEWDAFGIAAFDKGDRLKLKDSYTEKPKVIERLVADTDGLLKVMKLLSTIRKVACGEEQIDSDGSYSDTDALQWIYERINDLEKEQALKGKNDADGK